METIVSIALLGIIMTASGMFFVDAMRSTNYLRSRQVGVQLADDALEQARSLLTTGIIAGRDKTSSDTYWQKGLADPTVAGYLTDSTERWDVNAATNNGTTCGSSQAAVVTCVPTSPVHITVNNVDYTTTTFIGSCLRLTSTSACVADTRSLPVKNTADDTSGMAFYRVVVEVNWSNRSCANSACSWASAELENTTASDPVFNINSGTNVNNRSNAPLSLTNPGNQSTDAGVPVSVGVLYLGGTGVVTWSAPNGMPTGLSLDTTTGDIFGTPVCATPCTVTVEGKDTAGGDSTVSFNWTVNPAPTISSPTAGQTLTSAANKAITAVTATVSGGSSAYTWAFAGLPTGLTASGAKVSGTPTTAGTYPVTVTVTDNSMQTATQSFNWVITPPPTIAAVADQTGEKGVADSVSFSASGGSGSGYTYSIVSGTPAGMTIAAGASAMTGTPTATTLTTYSTTVKVTDSAGGVAQTTFNYTVYPATTITTPATQTTDSGVAASLTVNSTGGVGPYTWAFGNLPAGITADPTNTTSSAVLSGTPTDTATTSYTVTATLTDSYGATSTKTFVWKINGPVLLPAGTMTTAGTGSSQTTTMRFTASGGSATGWAWSISPTLSGTGLTGTASGATYTITGLSSVVNSTSFSLTVTDSLTGTANRTISWKHP